MKFIFKSLRKILKSKRISDYLIEEKCNLQDRAGNTLLMMALIMQKEEIAKRLLNNPEIDVNLENEYGNRALLFAKSNDNKEIIDMINEKNKHILGMSIK